MIQPTLLGDGRVCVDMGPPTLDGPSIPTTLPTKDGRVVNAPLAVAGRTWNVTCVSMGNPHAVIFSNDAQASLEVLTTALCAASSGRCCNVAAYHLTRFLYHLPLIVYV